MLAQSHETLLALRIVPGNNTISFGGEHLSFGRLQCLNLSEACYLSRDPRTFEVSCFDASAWSQLLIPSLEYLFFPDTQDGGFREALATTANLPNLKHVTAHQGIHHRRRGDAFRAPHKFLARHAAQLEELRLGATTLHFATRVFRNPDQWSRLSTLRLAIKVPSCDVPALDDISPPSVTVPVDLIMALGQLSVLESLYLAVGCGKRWKHQWRPDHALLLSFLGRLTKLRHLAFLLDTYPDMPNNALPARYNPRDFGRVCTFLEDMVGSERYFDPTKFHSRTIRQPPTWTLDTRPPPSAVPTADDHIYNMGKVAHDYAAILPNLEWVFCGQWSMGIGRIQLPACRLMATAYFVENAPMDCWGLGQRRPGR